MFERIFLPSISQFIVYIDIVVHYYFSFTKILHNNVKFIVPVKDATRFSYTIIIVSCY